MSGYEIRKTNNEVLVDNLADNTTVVRGGITLIGRNRSDYGDAFNENLVRLLENFSNSSPPVDGLIGQLWFDSASRTLKVKFQDINPLTDNLADWKSISGATISPTQPATPIAGDLWYDTTPGINQLKIYDGSVFQVIGPEIVGSSGVTGLFVDTVTDTSAITHDVIKLVVNSVDTLVISRDEFTPATLSGFGSTIVSGLNFRADSPVGKIRTGSLTVDNSGIIPLVTSTINLGSSNLKFATVYADNLVGTLVGGASTAISATSSINSTNASNVGVATDDANLTFYPTFVSNRSGNLPIKVDDQLTYNPFTDTLVVPNITSSGTIRADGSPPFEVTSSSRVNGLNASFAGRLDPGATIALQGAVNANAVNFRGDSNITLSTTIPDNSIDLSTKSSVNYVTSISGSSGITVSGGSGKGSTPIISLATDSSATFNQLTVNGKTRVVGVAHVNSLSVGSGIATPDSTNNGEVRVEGEITAYVGSDIALKENIVPIANPLDLVKQLRGVYFDWRDDHIARRGGEDGYFVRKKDMGIIAQDVKAVFPEIVTERSDGTLAVKYDRLVSVLIEAVKDLTDKVKDLENRLDKKN
jgi:hypothetical protein